MSIKTNLKRIALVAVASVGIGLLSSAPSQAVVINSNMELTTTAGTATLAKADSTTAATFGLRFLGTSFTSGGASDSVVLTITNKSKPSNASSAPQGYFLLTDTGTSSAFTTVKLTGGDATYEYKAGVTTPTGLDSGTASIVNLGASNAYAGANYKILLGVASGASSLSAGTYVYTVTATPWDAGSVNNANIKTIDVTFTVAAISRTADPATSTAYLNQGTSYTTASDSTVVVAATASTTARAVIYVTLKDL